ncbi:hypothetical protein PROH_16240 [Prochlorothrix hollandica PCC 9006 = CALU 1027]|uniref:Uncharacterized protein n=2 Tax=Prochlorothrix hollandica TaxID=1223 RepID=A0A0M2PT22_PROHO|nr:hypothetical protein PROH_16240 [Prochlorothrix hollandica PCC 9006 = CALU 1027]
MGKFLKTAGLLVLALGVGAGVLAYAYWQRLTALPDWYQGQTMGPSGAIVAASATPRPATAVPAPAVQTAAQDIRQRLYQDLTNPAPLPVELTSTDLETLVLDKLLDQEAGSQLLDSVQGFDTTIEDGRVKGGAVINTDSLPRQALSPRELEVLDRLLQTVPGLQGRDLYIGLVGQPQMDQGTLSWQDGLQIQVGTVTWGVTDLADQLGVDPGRLEQELNKVLRDLPVESLRIDGDRVILQGISMQGN